MSPAFYQSPPISEQGHAAYEEYNLLQKESEIAHPDQLEGVYSPRQGARGLAMSVTRVKHWQTTKSIALVLIGVLCGGFFFTSWSAPQDVHSMSHTMDQLVPAAEGSRLGIIMLKYGSGTRFMRRSEQDPFERAIGVNREYAKKWGYPHWLSRQAFLTGPQGDRQTAMYTKQGVVLSVILDELRKPEDLRLDWVFYFDADAVIVNHNVPLETFLPPENEFGESQFLLCSRDPWGTINAGVFAIRVSELSVKFLTTLISVPTVLDTGSTYNGGEQSSMCRTVAHEQFSANVSIVPSFWFNADSFALFDSHYKGANWPDVYRYGDFLIHFMSARKRMFREVLDAVELGANSTLAPPLDETRYITGKDTIGAWYSTRATVPVQERIRDATTIFSGKTFTAIR